MWWHSSMVAGPMGWLSPILEHGESWRKAWQEWKISWDEDGDWSYSTAPGDYTMDVLRERFGEASFHETPVWEAGLDVDDWQQQYRGPQRPQARLQHSPKARMDEARLDSQSTLQVGALGHSHTGPLHGRRPHGVVGSIGLEDDRRPIHQSEAREQQFTRRDRSSIGARPTQDIPRGPGWPTASWGPPMVWGPLPLQCKFDGNPDHLALFLSQTITHLDQYAQAYPSQWAMVVAVTAALQGEAAEWVADLHTDHARELAEVGLFLDALRIRFEDGSRAQRAEAELLALRQNGRIAIEYVQEFRRVAGKVRGWPES